MTIIDPNMPPNMAVMEEKMKNVQNTMGKMEVKHDDNGKKLDAVLLQLSKMEGTNTFIAQLYTTMQEKTEQHTIKLESYGNTIVALNTEVTTIKDKLKGNATMLWSVIVIVIAQLVNTVFNLFK